MTFKHHLEFRAKYEVLLKGYSEMAAIKIFTVIADQEQKT